MYSLDISSVISCSMFGRMKQTTGWGHNGIKTLASNLFVFIISGSATFTFDNKIHTVSERDILIIPKNTPYQRRTENFCEYFFFHFSGDIKPVNTTIDNPTPANDFSFILPTSKSQYVSLELLNHNNAVFDKIYSCIINCVEYKSHTTRVSDLLIDAEFLKIMLFLSESIEKTYNSIPQIIQKMCVYIRKNITRNMTLSEISSKCSISVPYASRIFKKHTGMTIKEYINNEKLNYARELLQNTSMNISEISNYLGYCDVFYFSKLFKSKFGKSPTRFLK